MQQLNSLILARAPCSKIEIGTRSPKILMKRSLASWFLFTSDHFNSSCWPIYSMQKNKIQSQKPKCFLTLNQFLSKNKLWLIVNILTTELEILFLLLLASVVLQNHNNFLSNVQDWWSQYFSYHHSLLTFWSPLIPLKNKN